MGTNHKHAVRHGLSRVRLVHNGKLADSLPPTIEPAETTFTEALKVITRVMREGRKKHSCGDWRQQAVEHHVQRARRHLARLADSDSLPTEDHVAHACCRLLMALTLRELS